MVKSGEGWHRNACRGNRLRLLTPSVAANRRTYSPSIETDILSWLRLVWTDPRLSWDPEDYNGLDKVWLFVADGTGSGEVSELWTPDLELWNMQTSMQTSFTNTYASVSPDGSVFWSRPGHLIPVCKFRGLHDFPFDKLVCVAEIGSWAVSGKYLKLELYNGGYSIGGSETSGESFSEFKLDGVEAVAVEYPPYPRSVICAPTSIHPSFPPLLTPSTTFTHTLMAAHSSDPLADWPVVKYSISFTRSWQPYIRGESAQMPPTIHLPLISSILFLHRMHA